MCRGISERLELSSAIDVDVMGSTVKPRITVKRISSETELAQAMRIRIRVFVREQGVPAEIELDDDDKRALHLLASLGGRAVGTARIVMRGGQAKIGRMAVLKSHRRKKVGKNLLTRAVITAKKQGARKIYLHAQVAVLGFYESAGFRCVGSVFDEAGIAHRRMVLGRTTPEWTKAQRRNRRP
jgi:predicted GNAT family N-acyltransferase